MSDFGEKVFRALAHQVNFENVGDIRTAERKLEIADPRLEFSEDGLTQIKNFKDAIFQLLMLRARNEFILHKEAICDPKDEKCGPKFVKVDLSIIFTPLTIHPEDKTEDADFSHAGISPNQIFPIASDLYDPDTMPLIGAFANGTYPLACGD